MCDLLVFPVLESRNTVLRKDCVISGRWPRIFDLFETLLLLERTGEQVMNIGKNFEHKENLDNVFKIFPHM